MYYLFQKRYHLNDLALGEAPKGRLIMLGAFPWEQAEIYARHLRLRDFAVVASLEAEHLVKDIGQSEPDLLFLNLTVGALGILRMIKHLRPFLRVVTLGGGEPNLDLPKLMALGVCGHLNRHLTRPKDVAVIARQVLLDLL